MTLSLTGLPKNREKIHLLKNRTKLILQLPYRSIEFFHKSKIYYGIFSDFFFYIMKYFVIFLS